MGATKKVALSGASGKLGSILRAELMGRGVDLRSAGGSRPLVPLAPDEDILHGDLRDPGVVDRLLTGVDVLIHMAGTAVEAPLDVVIENNLRALREVYEGAVRHDVRRVVFASSNHAFGMYPVTQKLRLDCEYRPDGMYGLSKVWGEAIARLYWDKHGIESICARIGTVTAGNRPTQPRHLCTWLANEDLVQLMLRCIAAENVGFMTVWGVSNNTRSYWENAGAERLGFMPQQNAEDYAEEILSRPNPLSAVAQQYQGGSLAALNLTRSSSALRDG
jgi:uronate dehydrogenase